MISDRMSGKGGRSAAASGSTGNCLGPYMAALHLFGEDGLG